MHDDQMLNDGYLQLTTIFIQAGDDPVQLM